MSKSRAVIVALLMVAASVWLLTPAKLKSATAGIDLPEDLDTWLEQSERKAADRHGLIPRTEKRVTWIAGRERTRYSVLYLHGFSATRQETAPLAATVARALGANLFETRLTGHGRERDRLAGVTAEDWLHDAVEALTIAAEIGERIIIIGTSTGATLAAAIVDHPTMDEVDTIVMLSPNFAPNDSNAAWLTRPAGPLLARLMVGETRSWEPHNDAQARYWSTTYPTAAAVEMMRLVDLANRRLPATISPRLLMFYSMDDEVVSPEVAMSVFEATDAPQKAAIEIVNPGDPSHHVLAGDVLSKGKTGEVAKRIVEFIRRPFP